MADILLVSKPVAPPWNDSSKNLVRDLAAHMQRHRPTVMTRRGAGAPGAALAAEVYPASAGGYAPALRDNARVMARLLTGRHMDLWHFFFAPNPRSSSLAGLAARLRGTPTVQTVCSAPHEDADLAALLFADVTIVLSARTEHRLLRSGIDPSRVRRIEPAVAPLEVMDDGARRAARERLGLPLDRPIVVYPGDLEFSGGAQLVVSAHAALPGSLDPLLVMACRPKTPAAVAARAACEQQARRLGVESSVRWIGETPDIHSLLGAADMVSLPADNLYAKMDLPLVVIEAMWLGRPALVAKATAAEELADGGGVQAVVATTEAVAAATARLLESPALRTAQGLKAREVAEGRFSPLIMASQYEAVYDGLLGG